MLTGTDAETPVPGTVTLMFALVPAAPSAVTVALSVSDAAWTEAICSLSVFHVRV